MICAEAFAAANVFFAFFVAVIFVICFLPEGDEVDWRGFDAILEVCEGSGVGTGFGESGDTDAKGRCAEDGAVEAVGANFASIDFAQLLFVLVAIFEGDAMLMLCIACSIYSMVGNGTFER